jgi:hypothetical protein
MSLLLVFGSYILAQTEELPRNQVRLANVVSSRCSSMFTMGYYGSSCCFPPQVLKA